MWLHISLLTHCTNYYQCTSYLNEAGINIWSACLCGLSVHEKNCKTADQKMMQRDSNVPGEHKKVAPLPVTLVDIGMKIG